MTQIRDPRRRRRDDGRPPSGASPRLYQRAFDILARRIGSGDLPPGTQLLESTVTAQFGISRTPARQALAELVRGGFVSKAPGYGYVVVGAGTESPNQPSPSGSDGQILLSSLPTWERLYGEVEQEIAGRTTFATWRVVEAKLAHHYGVSRTVARDVLGRLQERGVVRKDARARWFAPMLTPDYVTELYELRWVLEPVALTKAAAKVPQRYLTDMRRSLVQAADDAKSIGGDTLDRLEEDLHITLLGHCGNLSLMQAITLPQSLLIAHRFLYRWTSRLFDVEPFLAEHIDIVDRLIAGDVAAAGQTLEHHLRVSRDRAIGRIDVVSKQVDPEGLPYLVRLSSQG